MKKLLLFAISIMFGIACAITCMGALRTNQSENCGGNHACPICPEHSCEHNQMHDGYYTCSLCDGTGRDKRISCRACRGTGMIEVSETCRYCHGSGSSRDKYGNVVRCSACAGKGSYYTKVYCSSCGGWGCVICSKCNGSGKVWIDD